MTPTYKEPCDAYGEVRTPVYKEEGGMCMAQVRQVREQGCGMCNVHGTGAGARVWHVHGSVASAGAQVWQVREHKCGIGIDK